MDSCISKNYSMRYIYIILASFIWGSLGVTGKILFSYGLSTSTVAFYRLFLGFIFLVIILLIFNPKLFKINFKGLCLTAILGFICQFCFNWAYFKSISIVGISTAVVLLYTAPLFTTILSIIFYKEKFTFNKKLALLLCLIGCFLTVTNGNLSRLNFNILGIIIGIIAGICYGSMPIISKSLMGQYHSLTILLYSFGFGALFLSFFSNPFEISRHITSPQLWFSLIFLGLFNAVLSYILYLKGLALGASPSKASMLCTLEVVVSSILAILVYNEPIGIVKGLGISSVLLAVLIIQKPELQK